VLKVAANLELANTNSGTFIQLYLLTLLFLLRINERAKSYTIEYELSTSSTYSFITFLSY